MDQSAGQTLTQEQIEALIPHRPPFLWLDSVQEVTGQRIVATKFISPNLDLFQGHYPQFPLLPGVIQCEAAFQAGAVLMAHRGLPPGEGMPVVTRVGQVQFRKLVRPGDTLTIEVELVEQLANAFFMKGKVSVGSAVTVRLEFACAIANPTGGA